MAVLHIPEEEAAKDLKSLLARALRGEQVVIDASSASVRLVPEPKTRTVAEALAILERLPGERAEMDEDFARDVMNFRKCHPESLGSKWE
ncbi:MAG TPA: hypothetical protein VIJ79_17975 [Acidobacteriaceae bacterium]